MSDTISLSAFCAEYKVNPHHAQETILRSSVRDDGEGEYVRSDLLKLFKLETLFDPAHPNGKDIDNAQQILGGQEVKSRIEAVADAELRRLNGDLDYLDESEDFGNVPFRIPTGFPALDETLYGGLQHGSLYVLAGITNSGKSTVALNLARMFAIREYKTLHVTLEDPINETYTKLVGILSGTPTETIRHFKKPTSLATHADKYAIQEARKKARALTHLKIVDRVSRDDEFMDLEGLIARIKILAKEGFRMVVVDQTSHVRTQEPVDDTTRAGMIADALFLVAKRTGIIVIAVVQINRTGARNKSQGERLTLQDIKDSSRWEMNAGGVIFIQDVKDLEDGSSTMELQNMKARTSKKGSCCVLRFNGRCGQIEHDPTHPHAFEVGSDGAPTKKTISEDDIFKAISADPTWKSFNRLTGMLYHGNEGVSKERVKYELELFWAKHRLEDLTEVDDIKMLGRFRARAHKGRIEVCGNEPTQATQEDTCTESAP